MSRKQSDRKRVLGENLVGALLKTRGSASPCSSREVHAVLMQDDESHSGVVAGFRAGGGNVDRWLPHDLATMGRAITAVEDVLELRSDGANRRALRLRLRGVRERLENASDSAKIAVPYAQIVSAVRREMSATR